MIYHLINSADAFLLRFVYFCTVNLAAALSITDHRSFDYPSICDSGINLLVLEEHYTLGTVKIARITRLLVHKTTDTLCYILQLEANKTT